MFDMQIRKAVITAAGKDQRNLPMQTLFDQHGKERSVLSLVVREAVRAGISDIGIVVWPGDEEPYARLLADDGARLTFVQQTEARGYAHAVLCAQEFVKGEPFLHFVGDHIYVGDESSGCAKRLVEAASVEGCAISAVQVTRENLLPYYGTVGGQPVAGKPGFYRVDTVLEKPTPTEAEQRLIVPGLRSGQYLCFYGMHVLTPAIFEILSTMLAEAPDRRVEPLRSARRAGSARAISGHDPERPAFRCWREVRPVYGPACPGSQRAGSGRRADSVDPCSCRSRDALRERGLSVSGLWTIITATDPAIRNRSLDAFCRNATTRAVAGRSSGAREAEAHQRESLRDGSGLFFFFTRSIVFICRQGGSRPLRTER